MNFDLFRAVPGRLATTEDSRMPCARPDRRGFRHDGEVSPLARWLAVSLLPLAALALSTGAQANNLMVTANVAATCTTSGATIAFGAYNSAQNSDVQPTFAINCTQGANFNINLGPGLNALGTARRMNNGNGGLLTYNLFLTNDRTTVWGNGTFGTPKTVASFEDSSNAQQQVFGRVPSGQSPLAGSYTDTVAISFTFTP